MNNIVIGIAGGTGSGKTTLAKRVHKAFGDNSAMLSMDCYYKSNDNLSYEERCKINYDHPDSIDFDLLVEHVRDLKEGKTIHHPTYNFSNHRRTSEWIETKSARVIIVEGIMAFLNPQILDMLDIKIYVDTDADVRIIRRILRDVNERGRSLDSVVRQYLTTVKPMHEHFIEPSKRKADVIVPEGGHNQVAYEMIVNAILKRLSE